MKTPVNYPLLCGLLVLIPFSATAPGQENKADPQQALLVIEHRKSFNILSMAVSADGKRIVTGHLDGYWRYGYFRVWDATTGEKLLDIPAHDYSSCWAVAFSPDCKRIASGGKGGVKIWDARTGKELHTYKDSGSTRLVAYSPDGKRIISGCRHDKSFAGEDTVRVLDAETGKAVFDLDADTKLDRRPFHVKAIAVSPDGKRIARAASDNKVRVWDAQTGKEILKYQADGLISLAFSPDSKRLVGASCEDGRRDAAESSVVKVWEADTGKELLAVETPKSEVLNCAAFSPDGKWIVAGGTARGQKPPALVRVWDAAIGREVATFNPKHYGSFDAVTVQVAFTPSGNRIVVANEQRSVQVFAFDKPAAKP